MFCQNCGEKLESQNQKYCKNCGSEILEKTQTLQANSQTLQAKYGLDQERTTSSAIPVTQYPTSVKREGEPGSYSKKSFAFAMVSLALAGVGFAFGGSNVMRLIRPYYYYYPYYSPGVLGLIIAIILNITGLIFGILSRTNCSKARRFELENTLEKVGGVFGVFGIVLNSIPVVVVLIILIIALISLMMFMPMYY
jgi:DNA-directed RNA polymerase subunit RPC12/RpoP